MGRRRVGGACDVGTPPFVSHRSHRLVTDFLVLDGASVVDVVELVVVVEELGADVLVLLGSDLPVTEFTSAVPNAEPATIAGILAAGFGASSFLVLVCSAGEDVEEAGEAFVVSSLVFGASVVDFGEPSLLLLATDVGASSFGGLLVVRA